jgi:hypothetical protein
MHGSMHGSMREMDGTAYFDRAVSYRCKMFYEFNHRCQCHKTFFFGTGEEAK